MSRVELDTLEINRIEKDGLSGPRREAAGMERLVIKKHGVKDQQELARKTG